MRRLDPGGPDMARAAIPVVLLLVAAALPWLAGLSLAVLAAGVIVSAGRRAPVVWAWAAAVPPSALLTARAFGGHVAAWGGSGCVEAGPAVAWAVGEALLVVGSTAVLVLALGALPGDVGLRRPPKYAVRWGAAGFVAVLVIGLVGVVLLGGPVLGRPIELGGTTFLLPAAGWAVAVAVAEEIAWRGAMQGWMARTIGPGPALLAQAALYGVAWAVFAADVLPAVLVGVLAGLGGAVLGALALRTRTVWTGLAWHVAFNVPFFVLLACST